MARIKGSFTVFPASAGVILAMLSYLVLTVCLSRVSGGDPITFILKMLLSQSFPRQRG